MKVTEATLTEMMELEREIKSKGKRLDDIKNELKAHGSFSTRHFIVAVTEQSRTSLEGLEKVAAIFGKDALESNNLIKTVTFKIVKVAAK